jgi:MFS family permease
MSTPLPSWMGPPASVCTCDHEESDSMMLATLRQRNIALLWLGGLISQTGDWLLFIGLPVYVYLLTGSALATSILGMASLVPGLLVGSLAGVFVDRWDRRLTMLIAHLLLAVGLLPLFFVHDKGSLWIVYLALFFEAIVSQFVSSAESALIPQLVSKEQLITANALNSVSSNVSRLAGAALGGILLSQSGLQMTVLLDFMSFLFAVAMLWLIRVPKQTRVRSKGEGDELLAEKSSSLLIARERPARAWLEGLRVICAQPPLVVLFVMFAAMNLGEGVFGVMLIIFVRQVLNSGAIVYGWLLSVQTIGGLLGGLLIGQFSRRIAPDRLIWICCCIFGLIDLLIIDLPLFIHGVWLVGLLFLLVGIPGVGFTVGMRMLLQTLVENRFLGRVSGTLLAVCSLMALVGTILAGVLGNRFGPVLLLNIQGSLYLLSGILALSTLSRMLAKRVNILQKELVRETEEEAFTQVASWLTRHMCIWINTFRSRITLFRSWICSLSELRRRRS